MQAVKEIKKQPLVIKKKSKKLVCPVAVGKNETLRRKEFWDTFFGKLDQFPHDFPSRAPQPTAQEREFHFDN